MSNEADFVSALGAEKPKPTLDDLFASDDDDEARKRRRAEFDDVGEDAGGAQSKRRAPGAPNGGADGVGGERPSSGTHASAASSSIGFDARTTTNELARQLLYDTMEAQLASALDDLERRNKAKESKNGKPRKKKMADGGLKEMLEEAGRAQMKRRPPRQGLSPAEYTRALRERRKAEKEEAARRDFSLVTQAAEALRSASPLRSLAREQAEGAGGGEAPADEARPSGAQRNSMVPQIPFEQCTIAAWVAVNGPAHVGGRQRALEEAVRSWMSDRDNRAWRAALQGGGAGGGGSFERNHPCKAANLPDATQCESFADLDNLARTHGDYVGKIEGAFKRSIDLASVWSGRVHDKAKSEELLMPAKCLQPSPNDAVLYHFLRHDHPGHWRARCEQIVFDSWDTPLERLLESAPLVQEAGKEHYAHCTAKDISQVLRNPVLVEAMARDARSPGPTSEHALLGFDAVCREAVGGIPHDSRQWDKSSLEHDNRAWRRSPRWAPFFAALVARLSCLPLPTLADLGAAGAWWTGEHDALEPPAMRAIRRHLAYLTVARTIYERIRHPKDGLWMKSRETLLVRELGCDQVGAQIDGAMRDWLYMRYTGLPIVHMLTASWLAYVFAPCCSKLDYTPLSFTLRAVGSDGNLLRRFLAQKRDQRDRGHRPDPTLQSHFADRCMAIGVLMTQKHAELKARGVDMGKEAAIEYAMPQDLSTGQLSKRMMPGLFTQCIWSDFRTNRSPFCVNGGATMEAVAIATMCRSYDRHRKPEKIVACTAGPCGVVGADASLLHSDFANEYQRLLPPVRAYVSPSGESLLHLYVTECCKRPSTYGTRTVPWLLSVPRDRFKSVAHSAKRNRTNQAIARACIEEFFSAHYLVPKQSPAARTAETALRNFDEVMHGIIRERLQRNRDERGEEEEEEEEEGGEEQSTEKRERLDARVAIVRKCVRAALGSSLSVTHHAAPKSELIAALSSPEK